MKSKRELALCLSRMKQMEETRIRKALVAESRRIEIGEAANLGDEITLA